MQSRPVVLCDANVLYGQWLRDLVMWLGLRGVLQPRWTAQIEQEWLENLLEHRPDLARARVERTARLMNEVLPQAKIALVTLPESQRGLWLPDPNDVHVLQAAITAKADYLVTFNLNDFPAHVCQELGVRVIHPDPFFTQLAQFHTAEVLTAVEKLQRQKVKPPVSWPEMTQTFARAGLPQLAHWLTLNAPTVIQEQ